MKNIIFFEYFAFLEYGVNNGEIYKIDQSYTNDVFKFRDDLNSFLKNYFLNSKQSTKILIYMCDTFAKKDESMDLIRLSYPCVEVKITGKIFEISGNYQLSYLTIYKLDIIKILIDYNSEINKLMKMSKKEMIDYSTSNNLTLKNFFPTKNTYYMSILNYINLKYDEIIKKKVESIK